MKKQVIIYTFSTCPYCVSAKNLLDSEDIAYREIVIDGDYEKLRQLKKENGMSTVPQILVDGELIGGYDQLEALYQSDDFERVFGA